MDTKTLSVRNIVECVLLCIILAIGNVVCQSYQNITDLRSALLSSYNADVIPVSNYSDTLYVNITLNLYSQPEVDPVRGSISTTFFLLAEWTDERLTWTPSNYEGIEKMYIKSANVWSPTISIAQSMDSDPLQESWMRIRFMYNGSAMYTPGNVFETSCEFYMKFWPFDKQTCYLSFYSFDYESDQLQFLPSSQAVGTYFYVQHGEWQLDVDSIEYRVTNNQIPTITYRLKFARQPVFYLLTVILPMNGLAALSYFVFLIPSAAGGRIGYSMTIMLSLAVFLTVISDELPKSANPVPVMCVHVLYITVINMLITIVVIMNTIIHMRSNNIPISTFYKFIWKISHLRGNKTSAEQDVVQINISSKSTSTGNNLRENSKVSESQPKNISSISNEMAAETTDNITWKDVSEAIDRLSLFTTIVVTHIPSIIILIYVANASDYYTDSIYWQL